MTNNFKKKKIYKQREKKEKINMYKIVALLIIVILIIIAIIFFIKNDNKTTKTLKIGKNSTSQEIVDYILNISSYKTQIEVEVKSNKNSNRYKINQTYIDSEHNEQEILEPSNIQGVKIIKDGNSLKVENTKLSITKIIEGYTEITQNNLDLSAFIENYKDNPNAQFREEENEIIMETVDQDGNDYQKYEKLYVSKENGKPIKMEIKDTNKNLIIYIIYNEIEI